MKCSNCDERDMKVVCHHCGKPLCTNKKCDAHVKDPAFSDKDDSISAHHCSSCLERHHPDLYASYSNK